MVGAGAGGAGAELHRELRWLEWRSWCGAAPSAALAGVAELVRAAPRAGSAGVWHRGGVGSIREAAMEIEECRLLSPAAFYICCDVTGICDPPAS